MLNINSSGNPRFPKSETFPDTPTVCNSSGNSSPLHSKADNKEKSTFKIPKKTEILYSKNESDLEADYDEDVVDDFVSDIFDPISSPSIP